MPAEQGLFNPKYIGTDIMFNSILPSLVLKQKVLFVKIGGILIDFQIIIAEAVMPCVMVMSMRALGTSAGHNVAVLWTRIPPSALQAEFLKLPLSVVCFSFKRH